MSCAVDRKPDRRPREGPQATATVRGAVKHVVCIHGDKIAILLTKFEGMDKKLDEFIIVNKDTNDEQYEKINQNTQHLAEMNGILKIVQRKVLNGSGV